MKKLVWVLMTLSLFSGGCFLHHGGDYYADDECKVYVTTYSSGLVCEEVWCFDYVYGKWELYDEYCY